MHESWRVVGKEGGHKDSAEFTVMLFLFNEILTEIAGVLFCWLNFKACFSFLTGPDGDLSSAEWYSA